MAKLRDKYVPPAVSPRSPGGWFYYVSEPWAAIIEALILPLSQNYKWQWLNKDAVEQAKEWSLQIDRYKLADICPALPGGAGTGGSSVSFPECIEFYDNVINIDLRKCDDMTVNIFFGCSCGGAGTCGGCQSAQQFGGGQSVGGGASASWIEEPDKPMLTSGSTVTDCDIVTGGMIDYIMDQQRELFQVVADNGGAVGAIIDGLAALVETFSLGTITTDGVVWLTDITAELADNVISQWNDLDFRDSVKKAWVKTYPNRQGWSSLTRQDILGIAPNLPYVVWQGVLPYGVRDIWTGATRMLNMNKINSRLRIYAGECDANAYGWYYEQAGVGFLTPPADGTYTQPLQSIAEWHYRFDFTDPVLLENGWESGNLPGTSIGGLVSGSGWECIDASGKGNNVGTQLFETLNLVAAQFTLTEVMDGDTNQVQFRNKTDENIVYDAVHDSSNVIFGQFEPMAFDRFQVKAIEWSSAVAGKMLGNYIESVELWGNGTKPTTGVEL